MLSKLSTNLTYANVVSTLCLFIVLGGGAFAATTITGKNVKDSSLTGKDVKNSSLTTSDVKNGSLLARDFKASQLPAGPKGSTGPQGPKGDKGDSGDLQPVPVFGRVEGVDPVGGKLWGPASGVGTAQAQLSTNAAQLSPTSFTARDLTVEVTTAPGTGNSYTFELSSGTLGSVKCTISDTAKTCDSGSATRGFAAGQHIFLFATSTGSPPPTNVMFGWRATTP